MKNESHNWNKMQWQLCGQIQCSPLLSPFSTSESEQTRRLQREIARQKDQVCRGARQRQSTQEYSIPTAPSSMPKKTVLDKCSHTEITGCSLRSQCSQEDDVIRLHGQQKAEQLSFLSRGKPWDIPQSFLRHSWLQPLQTQKFPKHQKVVLGSLCGWF